ncbi:unnamed protein product [Didymodactylos carnosus]|uniref:Uncharacterized protein n=1 Tax=Didymodactylos carnosus TaxID=1234261 RepID=A0A814ACH1_9BILA|nr:unnamed protein product [Didymodactylos carnosus]CAF0913048.1 unnamed protein product [Didymodactylos carnosus]CAF3536409.1 unnamed protein product [Didymodactylos carnosus]CAF3693740.1 unnamed protein product [Didymodactylos carnosus]
MPKATVLVQGASRGIGLEFVRALLKREKPTHVIATCRNIRMAERLTNLQKDHQPDDSLHRLDVIQLDVRHHDEFDNFSNSVETCLNDLKHDRGLDMLINCGHIYHPSNRVETNLNDVLGIDLNDVYQVNVVGPLLITKILMKYLKKGCSRFGNTSNGSYASIILNISAELASIKNNQVGGWYAYRLSKCALNMATKNLAIEFGDRSQGVSHLDKSDKPLLCVAMHPGIVNSEMIHAYKELLPNAHFETKENAVKKMLKTIDRLSLKDNGKYLDFDGNETNY